jgi:hypothetical protein
VPWRGPAYPGEVPTLGYHVLDWFAEYLIVPDGPLADEPLLLTDEQAQFVLNLYAVDATFDGPAIRGAALVNGRLARRAILSRPKGWGKSPVLGALCLAEALADVVLDGWDADGEPVGRPWTSLGFKAKIQVVAVSEDQTTNVWDPLLDMARGGPVIDAYDIDPLDTFVSVPRGRIEPVTSSSSSREGFRPIFSVLDQTESWTVGNGGVRLAAAIRRNVAKVNGCSVEAPNAFVPGDGSVAEKSHEDFKLQAARRSRGRAGGILLDHREAAADTDPTDPRSLMAGLAAAYGDSADANGGWVNLERIAEEYWDTSTDPQDARRFYLNQVTHASDSWLAQPEWAACVRHVDDTLPEPVADQDLITLGFDGSRARARGVTDATALVGCRLSDGHVFLIRCWEQPDKLPPGQEWRVPTAEVDKTVRETFERFNVVGFYADPAKWESWIASWEAEFGTRLQVKATRANPIEWWITGGRSLQIVRALEQFHNAVLQREMTHDGSSTLSRHVLNARRRTSRSGVQIAKEHPDSPKKIDAAVAAVLAWQARVDAVAAGVEPPRPRYGARRIR